MSHLSHQQCKDTTSQRNDFIWTAGGLLPGEDSCTLFDKSCNAQKCSITSQISLLVWLPAVPDGAWSLSDLFAGQHDPREQSIPAESVNRPIQYVRRLRQDLPELVQFIFSYRSIVNVKSCGYQQDFLAL